jgi:hypothetical protein
MPVGYWDFQRRRPMAIAEAIAEVGGFQKRFPGLYSHKDRFSIGIRDSTIKND